MPHALNLPALLLLAAAVLGSTVFAARVALALIPTRRQLARAAGRRFLLVEDARTLDGAPVVDLTTLTPDWWTAPDPNTSTPLGSEPPVWETTDATGDGRWWVTR
jgi:hypothetical protein